MDKILLALTLKKRLLLLFCTFLIGFFMVGIITSFVMWKFPASTPALRIVTVLQDVLMFVLPAVLTALIVTRQPASLLGVDRGVSPQHALLAVLVLLSSIPAMNLVIYLNENLPLPEGLASTLASFEDQAAATISALTGPHTVPNLIVSVLIVGVLTGVSEELLFRGGFQRLLTTGGVNPHCAIWISAALFSLLHMQFYGFVPRMLLGAFFGYALWWSGSLWLPILLHALNNTIYVVDEWINYGNDESSVIDTIGSGADFVAVIVSAALVVAFMRVFYLKRLH